MKEPPETFKFAEALFEFRRELLDGQLHVFRNRAGVAGDIFAAFKVRRNKEGAARHDLTGFELTAAFFECGDEPLERMDRIVEHFRRIACLDKFAVLEEFAADGIEAGNGERLAVNGRAVNDAAADGAVGNHKYLLSVGNQASKRASGTSMPPATVMFSRSSSSLMLLVRSTLGIIESSTSMSGSFMWSSSSLQGAAKICDLVCSPKSGSVVPNMSCVVLLVSEIL